MSLIAWYPLSGDTNDYSGNENHLEIINGTNQIILSDTGKTGKSYYKPVASDASYMKTKRTIDVNGDVSMSCWAYVEETNNGGLAGLVSNHNHNINMGWGINCTGSGENLCFTVNIGYGDTREYNLKKSKVVGTNKWTHFTFTYNHKTNKLKFYVNGEYDKEFTLDKTPLTQPDFISIFSWSNGYNSVPEYRIKGKIQNVKIYNHTLSIKEVKEDYKTKVVELRFENPVEPVPNIVDGLLEKGLTGWAPTIDSNAKVELCQPDDISDIPYIKCTRTGSGYDGLKSIPLNIPCKPNTKYTISVEVYIPIGIESELRLYCPEYNSSNTLIDYRHQVTIPLNTEKGVWHKFEYTWTSDATAVKLEAFKLDCFANKSTPLKNIFYARKMQLVECDHRVEMSEFKYSRISDSSGLGNHAYFNDTKPPQWMEESPIGVGSYRFEGNSSLDLPNNFLKQDNLKQSWTVNAWLRITDITKSPQFILSGFNKGIRALHNISDRRALLYINDGSNDSYRYSNSINQDEWVNLIFAFDHETNYIKIFMNGQDWTAFGPGPNDKIPAGIDQVLQIGTTGYYDLAKLEIYVTPFTLEDAEKEYKLKASIDKNITIHSNSIVEKTNKYSNPNDNLIQNGFLEYGDNRGFISPGNALSIIKDDKFGGYDCFERAGYLDMTLDEMIEVDPYARYELSGYFKSCGAGLSKLYFGFRPYDEQKQFLEYHYNNLLSDVTKTTLARTLNYNDTKVYLNSIDGWASTSAPSHQRIVGFFIRNGFPDYRFTNVVATYSDKNESEKYLVIPPWKGDTISAGSKVANCMGGATYEYTLASGDFVPNEWTKYSAIISGMQTQGENARMFRPTTKYIRVAGLLNYQQDSSYKIRFTHLCLRNLDTNESIYIKPGKPLAISKKDEFICDEINTVGPTTGLIFWSDLIYNNVRNKTMKDIPMTIYGPNTNTDITPNGDKVFKFNQTDEKNYITANVQGITDLMTRGKEYKSYTLHANIKIDGAQVPESIVLIKSGNHSGLMVDGSKARFATVAYNMDNTDGARYLVEYDISRYYGKWISITGLYEMNRLALYINGKKVGETWFPQNRQFSTYSNVFFMGGMNHDGFKFKGSITNARIYERALSDKEIQKLHDTFINGKHSINKNGVINCGDIIER